MDCFALIDRPRTGAENMAADDAMLQHAAQRQQALLRLYTWSRPTLSLGYFQRSAERERHGESLPLELVRRGTGGGAIIHHHDWTYALTLPPSVFGNSMGAALPLYDCVHDQVVQWLLQAGYSAEKWTKGDRQDSKNSLADCRTAECSFLCFERRSDGDVVVADSKVMGSAQRRYRGGLLQHGSLLLKTSEYAPSLTGLENLAADQRAESVADAKALPLDKQSFFEGICHQLTSFLRGKLVVIDCLEDLLEENVVPGKYATAAWNYKR